MSRQQTPDIMSDLMNGSFKDQEPVSNKTIIHENHVKEQHPQDTEQFNNKAIKQVSSKNLELASNKTHIQNQSIEKIETKEKATFNLSLSSLEALEDAWIKLKRQFKGEQRITKTAIVEAAIEIAINDLMEKNSASLLHKKILNSQNKNE